jgi:hypothetical protein
VAGSALLTTEDIEARHRGTSSDGVWSLASKRLVQALSDPCRSRELSAHQQHAHGTIAGALVGPPAKAPLAPA